MGSEMCIRDRLWEHSNFESGFPLPARSRTTHRVANDNFSPPFQLRLADPDLRRQAAERFVQEVPVGQDVEGHRQSAFMLDVDHVELRARVLPLLQPEALQTSTRTPSPFDGLPLLRARRFRWLTGMFWDSIPKS